MPGYLSYVIYEAAHCGQLEVLEFAHQRGASAERMAVGLNAAARQGQMDCLLYLLKLGCVLSASVLRHAADCAKPEAASCSRLCKARSLSLLARPQLSFRRLSV